MCESLTLHNGEYFISYSRIPRSDTKVTRKIVCHRFIPMSKLISQKDQNSRTQKVIVNVALAQKNHTGEILSILLTSVQVRYLVTFACICDGGWEVIEGSQLSHNFSKNEIYGNQLMRNVKQQPFLVESCNENSPSNLAVPGVGSRLREIHKTRATNKYQYHT